MSSSAGPVAIPATPSPPIPSGKTLPQSGKDQATPAKSVTPSEEIPKPTPRDSAAVSKKTDLQSLLTQLNKYLNVSGRPNQFRIDPASRNQTIQEINPSSGEVIGEYAASQFPALARSLGVSGVLVDSHA